MQKAFLLPLLSFCIHLLPGQSHLPSLGDSSTVWKVTTTYSPSGDVTTRTYETSVDTLINGYVFWKVMNGLSCVGFLRDDTASHSIVGIHSPGGFLIDTTSHVLCDFSLTVGDTFANTVPSLLLPSYFVILKDTLTTTLEGSRRILQTDYPGISWIESVGATAGPFYLMELVWDMFEITNCLERDGIAAYGPIYPTCDIFLTSATMPFENTWAVEVATNPDGIFELQIHQPLPTPLTIELWDLNGRCVLSEIHSPSAKIQLNGDQISTGIYLLKVSQGIHMACLKISNP